MNNFVKDNYLKIYKAIGFERSGLFKLIKKEFNLKTVLYPGCLIHVTPSFYFNHVIYADKSELSVTFFKNDIQLTSFINQNKTYKESSYWDFINKDFQQNLGLLENSFDLLLSVFSGKLINYCEKYVKPNGIILTNSLFSDNESIKKNKDYILLELINCKNEKYCIDYDLKVNKIQQSKLRSKNNGFEYVDNEEYYIYRKKKNRV